MVVLQKGLVQGLVGPAAAAMPAEERAAQKAKALQCGKQLAALKSEIAELSAAVAAEKAKADRIKRFQ
jgi:hypothetical protein